MNQRSKLFFVLSLLSLSILSVLFRLQAFSQTPFANGWDSYFYLVQLKSMEETGSMHSPEASLIYPYLRVFYWMTGDYVTGMKTGVAVLCGFWVLVIGGMAFRPSGSAPFPTQSKNEKVINAFFPDGLKAVLPMWALFSPQLTYFAAQYPKNLLGLILLVLFIHSLQRPLAGRLRWLLPVILLILNYFGHRMTFGLAVLYAVLHFVFQYRLLSATLLKKGLLFAGVALALFLLAGQFFPGLAHLADAGRLQGTFRWVPHFAPWSFVQTFGFQRISAAWLFEIIVVTTLFLYALVMAVRRSDTVHLPLLLLCALLIFPFLEWSSTGLAWRCWMVFLLLAPLSFSEMLLPGGEKGTSLLRLVLFAAALFSWKSYRPALHDPDYGQYQKITERTQAVFGDSIRAELVIAHNALAEYFTFTTGTDAMPWLPEYAIDSSRLWRIAAGVEGQTLRYFAGEGNAGRIWNLGGHYYLLPEGVWQGALQKAQVERDSVFLEVAESWRNPWKMRPGWLLRKKK